MDVLERYRAEEEAIQASQGPQMPTLSQEDFVEAMHFHEQWLNSGGQDGKRANLRGYDLRKIEFRDVIMSQANLREVNVAGVDFTHVSLASVDFSEAMLDEANLREVDMTSAVFSRASMRGINAEGATLVKANLTGANVMRSSMHHANCEAMVAREAFFDECLIHQANMTKANLRGSSFANCDLRDVQFYGADIRESNMNGVNVTGADFTEAQCRGATFEGVFLRDANIAQSKEFEMVYITASQVLEHQQLDEKRESLELLERNLKARESAQQVSRERLERDRKEMDELKRIEGDLAETIHEYSGIYKYSSIALFFVVAAIATIIGYMAGDARLKALESHEVSFIIGGSILLLLIHFVTAILSFKTYASLTQFLGDRSKKKYEMSEYRSGEGE